MVKIILFCNYLDEMKGKTTTNYYRTTTSSIAFRRQAERFKPHRHESLAVAFTGVGTRLAVAGVLHKGVACFRPYGVTEAS